MEKKNSCQITFQMWHSFNFKKKNVLIQKRLKVTLDYCVVADRFMFSFFFSFRLDGVRLGPGGWTDVGVYSA